VKQIFILYFTKPIQNGNNGTLNGTLTAAVSA
jgi:hypothetical protein